MIIEDRGVTISEMSKEAVNAGQLYGMADDLGKILGTDVSVDDNGFVYVNSSFNVGQQDPTDFTVPCALQHLKTRFQKVKGKVYLLMIVIKTKLF